MNRRNIAPWKPLGLAFGATLLITVAAVLTIAAVVTSSDDRQPFGSDPQAASFDTATPSPRATKPANTPEPAATTFIPRGPVATRPQLTPTPEPTTVPVPATPPPAPVTREPAAVDPPPPPPPAPTPTPIPGQYRPDITSELYTLLNKERTSRGLAPVTQNASLIGAAEYYVRFIFLHDPYDLDHWLDGGPGNRAWSRGYCCGVGEILVESEGSAQSMVDLWMSSPPHHDVILDPQYVALGIACYDGNVIGGDGNLHHPIVCEGDFGSG